MRSPVLALAAAALLGMLLTRGPAASAWSVQGQQLLRDGRPVLTCHESGWLDVLWQLGWPERTAAGEDGGQNWSRYEYPRLGVTVWMGELWDITSVDCAARPTGLEASRWPRPGAPSLGPVGFVTRR